MRNEELETKLQTYMERCWKLKQIVLSQQAMLMSNQQERAYFTAQMRKMQGAVGNAVNFAADTCAKMTATVSDGALMHTQQVFKVCIEETDKFHQREHKLEEKLKTLQNARDEIAVEFS